MEILSTTIAGLALVLLAGLVLWRVVRSRRTKRRSARGGGGRPSHRNRWGASRARRPDVPPRREVAVHAEVRREETAAGRGAVDREAPAESTFDADLADDAADEAEEVVADAPSDAPAGRDEAEPAVFADESTPVSETGEVIADDEDALAAERAPDAATSAEGRGMTAFELTRITRVDPDPLPSPAPVPPSASARPPEVAAVPVHFATDREVASATTATFTGRRGDGRLVYGRALVTLPPAHRPGLIERPRRILGIFREKEDPSRHVMIVERALMDEADFLSAVRAEVSGGEGDEALLFIHGFNVVFDDALRRTAQLAYDLNFPGPALLYSWPSRGRVADYVADGSSVEWTVFHLRDFLERILLEVGASAVHVIAHSMGNRALVAAIRALDFAGLERRGAARLRQVVFTAPDIDAATFRDLARTFERGTQAERFTLYASSRDKALEAAQRLNHYPRAGDSGDGLVVVDTVDTIDASEVETDFLGHSYYGEAKSVISDLYYLIGQGIPPGQRAFLREVEHPEGQYWRFRL